MYSQCYPMRQLVTLTRDEYDQLREAASRVVYLPPVSTVGYRHRGAVLRELCQIYHRHELAGDTWQSAITAAFERVESGGNER